MLLQFHAYFRLPQEKADSKPIPVFSSCFAQYNIQLLITLLLNHNCISGPRLQILLNLIVMLCMYAIIYSFMFIYINKEHYL